MPVLAPFSYFSISLEQNRSWAVAGLIVDHIFVLFVKYAVMFILNTVLYTS